MKYPLPLIGILLLLAQACQQPVPAPLLAGHWQAVTLVVADSIWDVELTPVHLHLQESNGEYQFDWYSGVQENGQFQVDFPRLYIQRTGGERRMMEILHLEADSLLLQGQLSDMEVRLGFRRVSREDQPAADE